MTGSPKIVMITGATGGFGEAFARKFADAGCKLILTSRKPDKLDKLAKLLKVPAHKIIMDVQKRKDIEAAFAAYEKDLFPRSAQIAGETAQNLMRFFDDTAPQSVVDLFSKHLVKTERP